MRRYSLGWLACVLVAAGTMLVFTAPVAAKSPLAGNWKVVVMENGTDIPVWLIQIEENGGKLNGKLLSVGLDNFKQSKLANFKSDGKTVSMNFDNAGRSFAITAAIAKGEKEPKKIFGSVGFGGPQRGFLRLERTKDEELDAKKRPTRSEAGKEFVAIFDIKDAEEKEKAFKDFAKKHAKDPLAYTANMQLLFTLLRKKDAKKDAIKTQAEKTLKLLAPFGKEMELQGVSQLAANLNRMKGFVALGLDYARKAEKMLGENDPPAVRQPILKTLVLALRANGKTEEAKDIVKQIAKLDLILDQEFLKTAIPFKPDTYKGRKGKSDRVAVVELFTGAQCPPCVAADVAFDALAKTYKHKDVIVLQYHLHIPGPDPLTNKDSLARSKFYSVGYTPFLLVNGKQVERVGGAKGNSKVSYLLARKAVDAQLEAEPQGSIKLSAKRKGDKIDVSAEVAGLKKPGEDIVLRFVVIEGSVRYAGSNGQRIHHHIVRAFPGEEKGYPMKKKAGTQNLTIDLKEVTKGINDYLTEYDTRGVFQPEDKVVALKKLTIVALIQDNESKEILQAAQVDVPDAK